MTLASSLQHARNAVFELVFVLTSDNHWIGYLSVVAMTVDFFQILSFGFSKNVEWGVPSFQKALLYFVLPWPINFVSYYVVFGTTIVMFLILLILFYQVFAYGNVSSIRLLRVGRLLLSFCATIIFFPFLETLLSAYKANALHVYDASLEARDNGITWIICSSFGLVLFYFPVFLFTVLYTIPDPNDREDVAAKITTRPEIIDLLCRSAMVLCTYASEDEVTNSILFWVIQCTSLTSILYYPYFVIRWYNYIRAGLSGSLVFVMIVGVYVGHNPQDTPTLAYTTLGLMPFVAALSAVLSHCRFNMLDARRFMKLENGLEKLMSRCFTTCDVELATRYCLESPGKELTEFGMSIFEEGLKKFPNSAYIYARFAIYLVFVVREREEKEMNQSVESTNDVEVVKKKSGNHRRLMLTIRQVIRRTYLLKPFIDLNYCFFYAITLLEQKEVAEKAGELKLDIIDSIRFKHDISSATYHFRKANECSFAFWRTVQNGPSITRLNELADLYRQHSDEASWLFKRLMIKFPKSTQVVDIYMAFLRQIQNDEKGAKDLEFQARKTIESKGLNYTSDMASNDELQSSNEATLYTNMVKSLGSNQDKKQNRRIWHRTAKRLSFYMQFSMTILLIGLIFLFAYSTSFLLSSQVLRVNSIGGARDDIELIAYYSRQMEIDLGYGLADEPLNNIQAKIGELSSIVKKSMEMNLRDQIANDIHVKEAWSDVDIPSEYYATDGSRTISLKDANTLLNIFTGDALYLSTENFTHLDQNPKLDFPTDNATNVFFGDAQWAFVVSNGLKVLLEHLGHVVIASAEGIQELVAKDQTILIALYSVIGSVPLLSIIFFVIPTYLQLKRERLYVLKLFERIPEDAIAEMMSKHQKLTIANVNDSQSVASRGTIDQMSDLDDVHTFMKIRSTPVWVRMFLLFVSAVASLLLILILSAYWVYGTSSNIYRSSGEVNYAGYRRALITRVLSLEQEIIRADPYIWSDNNDLITMSDEAIKLAEEIHLAVKEGDPHFNLYGSIGRYGPQDLLVLARSCTSATYSCLSLDELYEAFLMNARISKLNNNVEHNFQAPLFKDMKDIGFGSLNTKLDDSVALFMEEVLPTVVSALNIQNVLFGIGFPLTILSMIYLRYISLSLCHNIDTMAALLKSIPYQFVTQKREILRYVKHGKMYFSILDGKKDKRSWSCFRTAKDDSDFEDDMDVDKSVKTSMQGSVFRLGLNQVRKLGASVRSIKFFDYTDSQSNMPHGSQKNVGETRIPISEPDIELKKEVSPKSRRAHFSDVLSYVRRISLSTSRDINTLATKASSKSVVDPIDESAVEIDISDTPEQQTPRRRDSRNFESGISAPIVLISAASAELESEEDNKLNQLDE